MSKKYYNFAAGWVKQDRSGADYISATANGKKAIVKLKAELEDGTEVPVNNFAVFFEKEKKNPQGPDTRFVFSVEE